MFYSLKFFDRIRDLTLAFKESTDHRPHLLLLDMRLKDGYLLQSGMIGVQSGVPFIIISSLDDLEIIRRSYQQGAFDFIVKPFRKNELLIAIERAFQSTAALNDRTSSRRIPFFGGTLNWDNQTLELENKVIDLTPKEIRILDYFSKLKFKPIEKSELLAEVWKDVTVTPKTLDVHLVKLRKKLKTIGITITLCPDGRYELIRQLDESQCQEEYDFESMDATIQKLAVNVEPRSLG